MRTHDVLPNVMAKRNVCGKSNVTKMKKRLQSHIWIANSKRLKILRH